MFTRLRHCLQNLPVKAKDIIKVTCRVNFNHLSIMNNSRGALIVFEGCDKSGKSTQSAKLVERLIKEGKKAELLKFPDRTTTIGKMIDNYLRQTTELDDHTIHLLFSANRWEVFQEMKRSLEKGTTLVVDRYAFSGVAFSAAKGLDMEWCKSPDSGLLKPDVVFFITVNNKMASERSDFGEERYEKVDFQRKVGNKFLDLNNPSYWKIVDGNDTIPAIHDTIYDMAMDTINQAQTAPISLLWTDKDSS